MTRFKTHFQDDLFDSFTKKGLDGDDDEDDPKADGPAADGVETSNVKPPADVKSEDMSKPLVRTYGICAHWPYLRLGLVSVLGILFVGESIDLISIIILTRKCRD